CRSRASVERAVGMEPSAALRLRVRTGGGVDFRSLADLLAVAYWVLDPRERSQAHIRDAACDRTAGVGADRYSRSVPTIRITGRMGRRLGRNRSGMVVGRSNAYALTARRP